MPDENEQLMEGLRALAEKGEIYAEAINTMAAFFPPPDNQEESSEEEDYYNFTEFPYSETPKTEADYKAAAGVILLLLENPIEEPLLSTLSKLLNRIIGEYIYYYKPDFTVSGLFDNWHIPADHPKNEAGVPLVHSMANLPMLNNKKQSSLSQEFPEELKPQKKFAEIEKFDQETFAELIEGITEFVKAFNQYFSQSLFPERVGPDLVRAGQLNFEALLRLAHSPSPLKTQAIEALGAIGSTEAIEVLGQFLFDAVQLDVCRSTLYALSQCKNLSVELYDSLIHKLGDEDADVRGYAALALSKVWDKRAIETLESLKQSDLAELTYGPLTGYRVCDAANEAIIRLRTGLV